MLRDFNNGGGGGGGRGETDRSLYPEKLVKKNKTKN